MKKLFLPLFGLIVTIIGESFKSEVNIKNECSISDTVTLNGFTKAEAVERTRACNTTKDNRPQNTQVWFRREIIDSMSSLLKKDSAKGIRTDGIRIYFSRDLKRPIHENNELIIVSTCYAGIVPDGQKLYRVHLDYFNDLQSSGLFKLKNITGEISHDKNSKNGALLFNRCHCDTANCEGIDPGHDISRSKGENMVHHFHRIIIFRKGRINARAEWFSMDMIEKLSAYLDKRNMDGVRIYFSRGTDNDETKRVSKFILVPTQQIISSSGDTIHRDFLNCKNIAANIPGLKKYKKQRYDDEYLTEYYKKQGLKSLESQKFLDSGGGLDNGELCPNHCPGTTLPQP